LSSSAALFAATDLCKFREVACGKTTASRPEMPAGCVSVAAQAYEAIKRGNALRPFVAPVSASSIDLTSVSKYMKIKELLQI
jgi:hypothetical protein